MNWFASTLTSMGLTDTYIKEAMDRISYVNDEVELDEALIREQVKAEMVVNKKKKTGKEAEETGDGKSSEDAEGKGPILNTPVDTGKKCSLASLIKRDICSFEFESKIPVGRNTKRHDDWDFVTG